MKRSLFPTGAPRAASRLRLTQLVRATMLAGLAMGVLPCAHADTTLDFEGLPPIDLTHGDGIVGQGFTAGFFSNDPDAQAGDAVGAIIDGTDSVASCGFLQCPAGSGNYATVINDGFLELTGATAGGAFGLKSFDASFLGSNLYDYPATPGFLRVQGFTADNSTMYEDYAFYAPGSEGFEFGGYSATSAFGNARFTSLYFFAFTCDDQGDCSAFSTGRGQFAIDNIALATSVAAPVPEPSTWLMMGAGLLGVAGAARRRKQAPAALAALAAVAV